MTGPASIAPTVIGRYRLESLLGGGGCGLVYAGRHEILGKPVAIKMLRPELVADSAQARRFFREARIAATLHHENIVDVTDFGEAPDSPYLVMELLRGRTLTSVVQEAGRLPWPRAVQILLQLTRALACAHRLGVIHRDLKPHNVMVDDGDRVKLCDFGLSRLYNGDDRITSTGEWVGTPAYMAPEQIRGEAQDARCDFYAFGVTAFEMLTGALPYAATNPLAMVAEILSSPHIRVRARVPADVPPALVSLIERCLAGDPADRPATATAIETALLEITMPKPARRPSIVFGAVVVAVVAAVVVMWPSARPPVAPRAIALPAPIAIDAPAAKPEPVVAPPVKPKPIRRPRPPAPPSDVIIADPFGGT